MARAQEQAAEPRPGGRAEPREGVTLRSVGIGLLLVVFVNFWILYSLYLIRASWLQVTHFPMGLFVPLMLLALLVNPALRAVRQGAGLSRSEILVAGAMGLAGAVVPGFSLITTLLGTISVPYYLATPENQWAAFFHLHMPGWIAPSDRAGAMRMLFEGLPPGRRLGLAVALGLVAAVATSVGLTLSLGPVEGCDGAAVEIDGQGLGRVALNRRQAFRLGDGGAWSAGAFDLRGEKRHGASGPVGDLFFDGLVLVPGAAGSGEEAFFNDWVAGNARGFYRSRNGGVPRGGIMGENFVDLPVVKAADLAEEALADNNLLLYGTPASNAVLARFEGELPVAFEGETVRVSDKSYTGAGVAVFAAFPHPLNAARCVAVHGGVRPDAICWGSHLDMHLLPDYLVYDGGELLDWGFWGNDWKGQ